MIGFGRFKIADSDPKRPVGRIRRTLRRIRGKGGRFVKAGQAAPAVTGTVKGGKPSKAAGRTADRNG